MELRFDFALQEARVSVAGVLLAQIKGAQDGLDVFGGAQDGGVGWHVACRSGTLDGILREQCEVMLPDWRGAPRGVECGRERHRSALGGGVFPVVHRDSMWPECNDCVACPKANLWRDVSQSVVTVNEGAASVALSPRKRMFATRYVGPWSWSSPRRSVRGSCGIQRVHLMRERQGALDDGHAKVRLIRVQQDVIPCS